MNRSEQNLFYEKALKKHHKMHMQEYR